MKMTNEMLEGAQSALLPHATGLTDDEMTKCLVAALSRIDELERFADGEGKPVGWETEAEWELEQRAFHWNAEWGEEATRKLINDLWREYCLVAGPLSELTSERDALRARVETLEGALKPFARIADMEQAAPPASVVGVNVDRLREASQALSPQQGDQP